MFPLIQVRTVLVEIRNSGRTEEQTDGLRDRKTDREGGERERERVRVRVNGEE